MEELLLELAAGPPGPITSTFRLPIPRSCRRWITRNEQKRLTIVATMMKMNDRSSVTLESSSGLTCSSNSLWSQSTGEKSPPISSEVLDSRRKKSSTRTTKNDTTLDFVTALYSSTLSRLLLGL